MEGLRSLYNCADNTIKQPFMVSVEVHNMLLITKWVALFDILGEESINMHESITHQTGLSMQGLENAAYDCRLYNIVNSQIMPCRYSISSWHIKDQTQKICKG